MTTRYRSSVTLRRPTRPFSWGLLLLSCCSLAYAAKPGADKTSHAAPRAIGWSEPALGKLLNNPALSIAGSTLVYDESGHVNSCFTLNGAAESLSVWRYSDAPGFVLFSRCEIRGLSRDKNSRSGTAHKELELLMWDKKIRRWVVANDHAPVLGANAQATPSGRFLAFWSGATDGWSANLFDFASGKIVVSKPVPGRSASPAPPVWERGGSAVQFALTAGGAEKIRLVVPAN